MIQKMQNLDWTELLEQISKSCTSEIGKNKTLEICPFPTEQEASKSIEHVLMGGFLLAAGIRPHMTSIDLFATWHHRLKKNAVLKTLEIKDVRSFCLESLALKEAVREFQNSWAQTLSSELMNTDEALSAIDQVLTPGGDIRSDASEKLYSLFSEKERLSREVQISLDRLVKDYEMTNVVQDKYVTTREGRWVLPIKGGMQHRLDGVIHGTSQTKQTVFMEPEKVIPTNNRLRQIELDIEEEIERILTELSHFLATQANSFEINFDHLLKTDILLAKSAFALATQATSPAFQLDLIQLKEIRHPLLVLSGRSVISNNVLLNSEKRILLLSGPNAGGKTVLLKSIGLACHMARCGLPICASEGSTVPFFEFLDLGIGDAQSVDEELSTFAAHLKILDQAAHRKGRNSLILIDEICGSTDPEEGSALARAFIEEFEKNNIYAVITSHLGPLKSGWKENSAVLNGSLEYDSKSGKPTYQFISGIPGDSLAIQTANRVGVSTEIVNRALTALSPETRNRLQGLEQIEQLRADILLLQDTLKKEISSSQQSKKKYDKLIADFEKEKEQLLGKALKSAQKQVDEAIQQARVQDTFKKHQQLQDIKYQLPEIVKAKPIDQGMGPRSPEEFGEKFPPGTKVFVPSLNQDGIVQSTPNSKGEVLIMSNSLRLQINWQELRPPGKPLNPTSQLVRKSSHFSVSLASEDQTLDLRGKIVEDALEELELALDQASRKNEDRIKIIHGHGTEALKKAVRTYLSRSIYVKKWKAGSPESGGDGITWVELGH